MPSPFPGMDPYLEGDLWTSFHILFAVEIARQLVPRLRPRYWACIQEPAETLPVPHHWVEIWRLPDRKVVTIIEFLTPANKAGLARERYLKRRRKILTSATNLIEVDLLRQGSRVPTESPLPPAEYYVFRSKAANRPMLEVWPCSLREPVPTIPVPLFEGDPDVALELQPAFTNVYDGSALPAVIDYRDSPDTPLPPDQELWADGVLRAAGLR
jgi:hypothetical protein